MEPSHIVPVPEPRMPLDESIYTEGDWPEMTSSEYKKKAADKAAAGWADSGSSDGGMSVSEAHCNASKEGFLPTGYYELPSWYDTWCSPPPPGWKTDWNQALYM